MFRKLMGIVALGAMLVTGTASADKKEIDLLIYEPPGGSGDVLLEMMENSLNNRGYTVNRVNLGSCPKLQEYMASNKDRAGVFISRTTFLAEVGAVGCDVVPRAEEDVITVMWARMNTICGRKGETPDTLKQKFANGKVTIAASTAFPKKIVEGLNGSAVYVPYGGTGGAIKGVIAGDTDLVFGGFSKRMVAHEELSCVGHGSDNSVDGMLSFKELFPSYKWSNLNSFTYLQGVNVSADLKAQLAKDVGATMQEDAWTDYVRVSRMIPATNLPAFTLTDLQTNLAQWK